MKNPQKKKKWRKPTIQILKFNKTLAGGGFGSESTTYDTGS